MMKAEPAEPADEADGHLRPQWLIAMLASDHFYHRLITFFLEITLNILMPAKRMGFHLFDLLNFPLDTG